MASWITSPKELIASGGVQPPQAWFRNFLCNRATKELLVAVEFFAKEIRKQGLKIAFRLEMYFMRGIIF